MECPDSIILWQSHNLSRFTLEGASGQKIILQIYQWRSRRSIPCRSKILILRYQFRQFFFYFPPLLRPRATLASPSRERRAGETRGRVGGLEHNTASGPLPARAHPSRRGALATTTASKSASMYVWWSNVQLTLKEKPLCERVSWN